MGAMVIGALRVDLGLETTAFTKGASQAEKDMERLRKRLDKTGKRMQGIGKNMSLFVTAPIVAFGVKARAAAIEGKEAIAQVEAGLASMGPVAGKTAEQLEKDAKALEKLSTFDDKEILRSVTANMLTFGNVANEQFDRAQRAAVDLSTRLDQDLKSSTILVGKALNDPITGLSSLTRVGITFTDEQKNMIKAMTEAGDVAGAQAIILEELERQYKGSGKAARDAAPGSDQINQWSDLKEKFGDIVLVLEEKLVPIVGKVMDLFTGLSPEMQNVAVGAALVAAAIGPVLFILGSLVRFTAPLTALIATIAGMGSATAVSLGASATGLTAFKLGLSGIWAAAGPLLPIILAIAGAGLLIYKNWDKIAPILEAIKTKFVETFGPRLQALVDKVTTKFNELWDGPIGEGIRKAIDWLVKFHAAYGEFIGEALIRVISAAIDIIAGFFDQIANVVNLVVALLSGDWAGAWQAAKDIVKTNIDTVLAVIESLAPGAVASMRKLYEGVKHWIQDKLLSVWNGVQKKVEDVKGYFFDLYDAVVGNSYIPDMVTEIGQHMARLDGNMVQAAKNSTAKTKAAFQQMATEVQGILARLFPEVQRLIDYKYEKNALEEWAKKGKISAEQLEEALRRLRDEYFDEMFGSNDPIEQVGPDEIQVDQDAIDREWKILVDNMNKDLLGPSKKVTGEMVVAFADMAAGVIESVASIGRNFKNGNTIDAIVGIIDLIGSLISQLGQLGVIKLGGSSGGNSGIGRSLGGPVVPGKTYRVGERGPEYVQFGAAGRVVPDADRRQGMVVNFNGVMTNDEFWSKIDELDSAASLRGASAGSQMALGRINKRNRQKLGR